MNYYCVSKDIRFRRRMSKFLTWDLNMENVHDFPILLLDEKYRRVLFLRFRMLFPSDIRLTKREFETIVKLGSL